MKIWLSIAVLSLCLFITSAFASQPSDIREVEGYDCMGYTKSRQMTEEAALANAKKKAVEYASSYIESQTHVEDFELKKDLVSAYANGTIRIIKEIEKGWFKDPSLGDCYKIKIQAEVIPDEKAMKKVAKTSQIMDDPSAPLNVKAWTDKKEYKTGEKIKVYIKGNKPFYARVLYKDVKEEVLQLLPNPYRTDNYFNGGVIYEIPSGNDRFEIEVNPPFGSESIIVYASTSLLGEINLEAAGGVYQVKTKPKDIGDRTRSVQLKEVFKAADNMVKGVNIKDPTGKGLAGAEFFEETVTVKTGR